MTKITDTGPTLVVNDSAPAKPENFISMTANRAGMVRNDEMGGETYLVVPMIMAVEGVLNGSTGPLYYPASELGKVPQVWNHKPVVVYHPTMNGKGVSACTPETITTYKIGVIMNAHFADGKLKAEAWLDEARVAQVDGRVTEAIANNTMMELSTGLFTDIDPTPGEFNGTEYVGIARNHAPDHLAILPDKKGACSIEDGAGFLRLNEAEAEIEWAAMRNGTTLNDLMTVVVNRGMQALGLVGNQLSHDAVHSQLRDAIRAKLNPGKTTFVWIESVFDDFFIYGVDTEGAESALFRLGYTVSNDMVSLNDDAPQKVVRVVEFRTADGSFVGNQTTPNNKELVKMNKEKVVNGLIENGAWSEDDRQFLLSLNEDQLTKMAGTDEDEGEGAVPPANVPAAAAPAVTEPTENSVADYIGNAPEALRPVLTNAMAQYETRKVELIKTITANEHNKFTAEVLNAKDINDLEAIAAFASVVPQPAAQAPAPVANYAGAANPAPVGNGAPATVTPLVAPTLNWD